MSSSSSSIGLDANLFFGVKIHVGYFWAYLLNNDKAFAEHMKSRIRKSNREFRKYEVEDMIDDIMVNIVDLPYETYVCKGKHGSEEAQCGDDFDDLPAECSRIETRHSIDKKRDVPITLFPSMTMRIEHDEKVDHGWAYVGHRIVVYKDGKPTESLPNLDEIEKWRAELQSLAAQPTASVGFCV